ncbi:MAG: hypothetical protein CM1200mP34_3550 [Verrucomicrobiales bacterium]|nr:MAG: hypothetical protein CM1200mP34_3550 [Verrucomicrobiales bacterium]
MRACCLHSFFCWLAGNLCAQFDIRLGAAKGGRPSRRPRPSCSVPFRSQAGNDVTAGLELTMDDGWHTYWINPGGRLATRSSGRCPRG